ncbi:MAG: nucleotide sugar dehydrogenase [Silvanigrellaceae bacterium]|nr:nucleotide sugar dehydrogenase [Silvanigrellaceae bacterium]
MNKNDLFKKLEEGFTSIGIIGLGYVGLPLAVSFSKRYKIIAFDINHKKIDLLKQNIDYTGEIEDSSLLSNESISYTSKPEDLMDCSVFIIAVPTPVDKGNKPNLIPLLSACETIGKVIENTNKKVFICFESTVYPGCTEDECIPIIEKNSLKKHGDDFFIGYSPERINPGDKIHKFEKIIKVVSGCCKESKEFFSQLYSLIVEAGVYEASTIKVAEAAKVIENTQRDINIALINELSVIFSKLNIDTQEVLNAAKTKWNFLNFVPGLVGGHCIGVDPYYLTFKAETVGYIPKVILSGRALNDSMATFIAQESIKLSLKHKPVNQTFYKSLILGFTFKENISDVRNTKVIDIINTLKEYNFHADIIDPIGNKDEAFHEYGIELNTGIPTSIDHYDLIILAVPHDLFNDQLNEIINYNEINSHHFTFIDIKSYLKNEQINQISKKATYWRL